MGSCVDERIFNPFSGFSTDLVSGLIIMLCLVEWLAGRCAECGVYLTA